MQARTRLLALSSAAGLVCLVIALGFLVHGVRPDPDVIGAADSSAKTLEVHTSEVVTQAEVPVPVVPKEVAGAPMALDGRTLVRAARASLEAGSPAEAESLALLAVQVVPGSSSAWNLLGRAQLACDKVADAEASFERACREDSANAWAWNNRGYVHLQCGEWMEARDALETAIGLRDDVAYFHNNLGLAYERTGQAAEAAAEFQRALALDPTHPTAQVAFDRVQARLQPALAVAPMDSTIGSAVRP
jgi:uncharacterized protein HemY